jgi:hypothetical protein
MVRQQGTFPAVALPGGGRQALVDLVRGRGLRAVDFSDWLKIDAEEVRRGAALGKPREKVGACVGWGGGMGTWAWALVGGVGG